MKRIAIPVLFLFIAALACQKKAIPVITERKTDPPKKIESIYPPKQTVTPDTTAGLRLFTSRCGRCHGLPEANQFTVEKWDEILPTMFPRAGMSNEEALHVWSYIMTNAKR